ncbi:hypothetical protein CBS101457_003410 [Exobasidium rhododendri]|nr:hypothetical protein CBS101457_003410 [Exobasidium rhododendri]
MAASSHPVVLVTGASKGLGFSITALLLKGTNAFSAANVVTISRSLPDSLQQLQTDSEAGEGETSLLIHQGDVCSESDNEAAIDKAIKKWGRLDAVILNAGVIEFARIADVTPSSFAQQMAVNVNSLITTLHYAIPHLRRSATGCGKVVFVSSGASVGNTASWGAYNASKAAVNAIARTLATEEDKIAVWAIRPGVIATSMQEQVRNAGKSSMSPADYTKFHNLFVKGELLNADQPGHVLSALAVKGTRSHPRDTQSDKGAGEIGAFLNWNDDVLSEFQLSS